MTSATMRALAAVYVAERQRMLHYAYRILGNGADAQDAVQDAFTFALRSEWRGEGPLQAWLMRILRNRIRPVSTT